MKFRAILMVLLFSCQICTTYAAFPVHEHSIAKKEHKWQSPFSYREKNNEQKRKKKADILFTVFWILVLLGLAIGLIFQNDTGRTIALICIGIPAISFFYFLFFVFDRHLRPKLTSSNTHQNNQ